MFKFLTGALAASLLVVGGCTLPSGNYDDAFQSACRNGPTVHLAFQIYADQFDVDPRIVQNEKDAYKVLISACNSPNPDKITAGLQAYAEILEIRNDT